MNRSDIRTEVRDIIGELTADFWTDAELNRYINEALRRFAGENRWSWLLTEGTGALTAGDPEMYLTAGVADYRHLHMMLTKDGDTRPYLPKRVTPARGYQLRQVHYTASAYPLYWYVVGMSSPDTDGEYVTTVRFIPEPTNDVDVDFQYYRVPADLDGDSDVPDVPTAYHKALVHFAAGTAWLKELNGGPKATEQFSLYDAVVTEALGDEEGSPDDDFIVVGGNNETLTKPYFSAQDYALRRIAPTLGP